MFIIKSKISLSILSVIIVGAFLFSNLFSYFSTKKSLLEEIRNSSLPLLSENIYSEIHRTLSLPLNVASTMSQDSFLINWITDGEENPGKIEQYLKNIKEKYNFFSSFYVSEITGNYYYYDGILKKISKEDPHDIWYFNFTESGKDMDLDVDTDEASSGILTIFINNKVKDFEGNFIGVTGVGIRLDKIADTLREKKDKYNRKVYLIDETGTVQVHTDIELVEKINIYDAPGICMIAAELMKFVESPIDNTYQLGSEKIIVSSRYIPELGWHVIAEQTEESSYHNVKKNLYFNLLLMIFVTALLFIISYLILKNFKKEMESLAGTDDLTGTANRRELIKQYNIFKYRSKRYDTKFSLIMIDLDNFKEINDTYGHLAGDSILKTIAEKIKSEIRPVDVISRWGGDEFVIFIESSIKEAALTAERIKNAFSKITIGADSNPITVTVSMGITEYKKEETLEELTKKADYALYQSKENGKNCITLN